MAESLAQLRGMSEDELIAAHDQMIRNSAGGSSWYLNELERRDDRRKTRTMLVLTWAIAVLTLVNVAAVVFDVLR